MKKNNKNNKNNKEQLRAMNQNIYRMTPFGKKPFTEYCISECNYDWELARKNIVTRNKSKWVSFVRCKERRNIERKKYNELWNKYETASRNPRAKVDELEKMQKDINRQGTKCDRIEMEYNARHLHRAMAYNGISSVLGEIKMDAMMNGLTEEELTFLEAPIKYASNMYKKYPSEVKQEEQNGWVTERDPDCDSEYSDEEHTCKICNKVRTKETNTNNKNCIKCLRRMGFKGVHYDKKAWTTYYANL